jgi:hypothetical protein
VQKVSTSSIPIESSRTVFRVGVPAQNEFRHDHEVLNTNLSLPVTCSRLITAYRLLFEIPRAIAVQLLQLVHATCSEARRLDGKRAEDQIIWTRVHEFRIQRIRTIDRKGV